MSDISKEAAFLKGLAEGMAIEKKSDEGRLIARLIDLVSKAADRMEELDGELKQLRDDLELLTDDVFVLESDVEKLEDEADMRNVPYGYDLDDDDDDLFDGFVGDDDEDDDNLFEIMCPECGEDVVVDFDLLDEENSIVCPNCHSSIELEFDMPEDIEGGPPDGDDDGGLNG